MIFLKVYRKQQINFTRNSTDFRAGLTKFALFQQLQCDVELLKTNGLMRLKLSVSYHKSFTLEIQSFQRERKFTAFAI